MKRIIALVMAVTMFATTTAIALTTTSEDYIPSETTIEAKVVVENEPELVAYDLDYVNTNNKSELEQLIKDCQERKDNAVNMAAAARELGYAEDHPVILLAKDEWKNANDYLTLYQNKYNEILKAEEEAWNKKKAEYPEASTVWLYLKDLGLNDYVIAGIMGNLMAEVGGQTLKLNPYLQSRSYYGMCQWNKAYKEVWGANLDKQCEFLGQTIKYELDTYGGAYKKGFNYDSFLSLTDEKEAALAFAKCYERCGSDTYSIRQKNATNAYNYFVD